MKFLILLITVFVGCSSPPSYEINIAQGPNGQFFRVMECKAAMPDCAVLVGASRMAKCKNPIILLDEREYQLGKLTARYLHCSRYE